MNKVLCASISALLMTGSLSAFAAATTYTDLDSGFELKSQPAWMEIGGRSFYGLANKPDKNETALNIICAYTAKEVEEATGKKFSTDEFLKKYKDLQVLERNGLSPDKVNYLLFMPDPYEIKTGNKLSLAPKELLDNSNISISTNKNGKQPYVYLHIVDNGGAKENLKSPGRAVDMQISITSANNMLYTVVSTFPLPNLKAQKEIIGEATPFTKKKVRNELTDGNKVKINGYVDSRKAFLKGLRFFTPAKETVPYGFNDELLGGRITLPDDWAYVQANDDTIDKKIPLKITLAMPWDGVSDFLKYHEEINKQGKEDASKINFQKISEAVLFASSRTKDKNSFAEFFENPILTNLIIDKLINEGLKHPSIKEYVDFKEVNTKSDFKDNYGTVNLTGSGSVKNNFTFNVNAKAMFTPQNFGLAAYIFRDDIKMNAELENRLEKITLPKI